MPERAPTACLTPPVAVSELLAGLPPALAASAVIPGSPNYPAAQHSYTYRGAPAAILYPGSPEEVAQALTVVTTYGERFSVRSGGHGISGRSTNDGGVVIDLSRLNEITIEEPGTVRLGAGNRWGPVARALAPSGLAITSGDSGDVGVGGLATVGGIGLLARRDGLTIDRVTGAEIVVADGRIVWTDADHEPELFWGIRGAGPNLGIVTSLRFRAAHLRGVGHADLVYDWPSLEVGLPRWAETVAASPREVNAFLYAVRGPRGVRAMVQALVATEDEQAIQTMLQPFVDVPGAVNAQARVTTYDQVVPYSGHPHTGQAGGSVRSALLNEIDSGAGRDLDGVLAAGADMVQIRPVGGAVNDIAPDATAYAHRHQQFAVMASGRAPFTSAWSPVLARADGLYLNFDNSGDPALVELAYPGQTRTRLRALKSVWDPADLFRENFPIV